MGLKIGIGRRIITPPIGNMLAGYTPARPAESVNDDVRVTAFAFEYENKQALVTESLKHIRAMYENI